jgi:hypothetical protein
VTRLRSPLPAAPPSAGQAAGGWWAAGGGAHGRQDLAGGRVPGGRRRSVPHLVVGALLVVACAVGFAVAASSLDHRGAVLALARPVTIGQQLTSGDVRSVRVSAQTGVTTLPASQLRTVIGQTMAVSLPAGALLAASELGPARVPAGQAVVAVAVKSGQAPPGLAAGEHVLLVPVSSTGDTGSTGTASTDSTPSTGSSGTSWSGVVTGVVPASSVEDTTVVSVQLTTAAAQVVAGLPAGGIDLVLVPGS